MKPILTTLKTSYQAFDWHSARSINSLKTAIALLAKSQETEKQPSVISFIFSMHYLIDELQNLTAEINKIYIKNKLE